MGKGDEGKEDGRSEGVYIIITLKQYRGRAKSREKTLRASVRKGEDRTVIRGRKRGCIVTVR